MDVGIVGGGAIGLLFGAYIAEENHQVTVYTRTEQQATLLNEKGIMKLVDDQSSNHAVQASCISHGITSHDLVIVAVKQYHIQQIQDSLRNIHSSIPILFIQNGMSHIDFVDSLPHLALLVGVVEHGALKENGNTVLHTGVGITKISTYKGNEELLRSIVPSISSERFPIIEINDWYEMLIGKIVVNAMINPLTALFRVENGQLLSNPYFHQLFKNLFEEITLLLNPSDPVLWWNTVVSVCEKTAHNRSSMLRDIEQNNKTEIESILGYIQTHLKKNNHSTPIIDFLYNGIKGLEK
ncbi:2-dehydropantoate 2-reductase [Bacillus suaedaesalsae]|uniref:2-dehydropantoate 2-reductase n=1 Tax=Bacillus suaedaesalsae TaxID=2810349 RepID=A0ABS2DJD0_9BACI|nr:2-dehydropantoate 2-reductase [Bacillus suaedaesalsae]MBM6618558.1 2-dehydropantoate 2-reductase [Bacillus suaedaesalsae]